MQALDEPATLEITRLPGLVRTAVRTFRRLTGLNAVASIAPVPGSSRPPASLLPVVHPRCARLLKGSTPLPPCRAEWQRHLRITGEHRRRRRHVCPLGLHCASVPIRIGDMTLGMAKCVAGPETPEERFASGIDVLEILITRSCLDLEVELLREKVGRLEAALALMRRAGRLGRADGPDGAAGPGEDVPGPDVSAPRPLIARVFQYLDGHYAEPDLTLSRVAGAVGRNEKYVAHLFVSDSGLRMRSYITTLRLRMACDLLLHSARTIEEIASASGFAHVSRFRELFRRAIGVTPSRYRQIFAAGTPPAPAKEIARGGPVRSAPKRARTSRPSPRRTR